MNNRYNFKGEIMNKIIVFDLDSTLLNDYGEVSQYTSKVLTKLKNQGHILVVNTARSYPFAMNIIDFIKPDYSIVNGGAQIVDKNGKNIFLKPIEHQYVSAIVADIESVSKFAAVQTLDNLYTDSDKFLKQHPIRFDFKNEFPYDAYKILCDINQDIDAFKIAKKHHLDYVSYYDSTYKVFRHFDTGKDKGMLNLLKMLKRDVKDVISFGDDAGDIEMLKISNIGVIMKNANPKYFENNLTISEYSNDEDGVARFLVKYFNLII